MVAEGTAAVVAAAVLVVVVAPGRRGSLSDRGGSGGDLTTAAVSPSAAPVPAAAAAAAVMAEARAETRPYGRCRGVHGHSEQRSGLLLPIRAALRPAHLRQRAAAQLAREALPVVDEVGE